MDAFGRAALLGLCFGFLWGIGVSIAIVYSIYLAGYRKAIKDSLKPVKPERFTQLFEKLRTKREKAAAKSARKSAANTQVAEDPALIQDTQSPQVEKLPEQDLATGA